VTTERRFPFVFDPPLLPFGLPFGVTPSTAFVTVTADDLRVRFGLWSLHTELANVAGAERTGPYRPWRVAGPARLSLTDRGLTFATTTRGGVCICFRRPVRPVPPFPLLRHPALTVTVADPDGLVELLASAGDRPPGPAMNSSGA
jgi:hypothetical protein